MANVDSATFRNLCGRFASGVVIVVAADPDGHLAGMTVSSFASVSLDPPLVSINIASAAALHGVLEATDRFTVHVLGAGQEALSRHFAVSGSDRFADMGMTHGSLDDVRLPGTISRIECEKYRWLPVGDHTIVVGRVIGGATEDGAPLLYFRGRYHTLP